MNQHQRTRAHLAGMLMWIAQELTPTLEVRLLGLPRKLIPTSAKVLLKKQVR